MKVEVHTLMKLDNRPIPVLSGPEARAEVRLFATARNELIRLPYFFDYYRDLGVDRFFIIDNDSTDKSVEFLLAQPDCHVFHTADKFNIGKVPWQNALLDKYGTGQWCLVVDADELFAYPHCETVKIGDYTRYLDSVGAQAVSSFLLDMYGGGRMDEAVYTAGQPFLDVCPYFDRDYSFMARPAIPGVREPFPTMEPVGGPRLRLFYPEWNVKTTWMQWQKRLASQLGNVLTKLKLTGLRTHLQGPPILYKVPFVKWKRGYVSSMHTMTPAVKLAPVSSAILHFKFFSDFHEKATVAAARGQHFGGGVEYKKYLINFEKKPESVFMYEGSVLYRSSQDLIDCGLVTTTPEFEALAAARSAAA